RKARRVADFHKIEAPDVYEAIVRMRDAGIDPFARDAVTEIVRNEGQVARSTPAANAPVALAPGRVPAPLAPPALPSREALTQERRLAEIREIQRDIARRRRRKLMMLGLRLAFFVFLPTILAGLYYTRYATPLYSTNSSFQIQQADAIGQSSGAASALAGRMASPDSVMVQEYLTSMDAMMRLDTDRGFKRVYQDPAIDPIQRLPQDASNAEAYKVYKKTVKIGYDPTDGILKMEVSAPDPALSMDFAQTLLTYAEEQIDQLTQRLREDQMKGSRESYNDAEAKVRAAQDKVLSLQSQLGIIDPTAESGMVMQRISSLENELSKKRLELGQLLDNPAPNQSRVDGVRGDVRRIETMIAQEREKLTIASQNRTSLADMTGQMRIAEADLQTRQALLAAMAEQMELSRIEANKQVRYLLVGVRPVLPDEASYPKAFQNTFVAFLIFSGIYLMLSLTASVLREQVSS
ncbi:MAG: capsule biosynthesis protein, partial [Paracoccus sp. (in: a-proteobacteria)]|nr:capsule biosynthesis protein [Paracoccus sp. (in: a-proteobacteria)]